VVVVVTQRGLATEGASERNTSDAEPGLVSNESLRAGAQLRVGKYDGTTQCRSASTPESEARAGCSSSTRLDLYGGGPIHLELCAVSNAIKVHTAESLA